MQQEINLFISEGNVVNSLCICAWWQGLCCRACPSSLVHVVLGCAFLKWDSREELWAVVGSGMGMLEVSFHENWPLWGAGVGSSCGAVPLQPLPKLRGGEDPRRGSSSASTLLPSAYVFSWFSSWWSPTIIQWIFEQNPKRIKKDLWRMLFCRLRVCLLY